MTIMNSNVVLANVCYESFKLIESCIWPPHIDTLQPPLHAINKFCQAYSAYMTNQHPGYQLKGHTYALYNWKCVM